MSGRVLSRYRLLERLGEGGMGVVYAAHDPALDRRVAVKLCTDSSSNPRARRLLAEEARAASALNHPNIAHVYDYGETAEGEPFVVMELVPGRNLAEVLSGGALGAEETRRIVRATALALEAAHGAGIVHRDIKPRNIQLTATGEVKVLDFGISRAAPDGATLTSEDSAATQTLEGGVTGTPAYMSPEQARGETVDGRSDLFSLGCVLYECLTGKRAFEGASAAAVIGAVLHAEPAAPVDVNPAADRGLAAVAMKLLKKEPGRRYATARDVVEALDGAGRVQVPARVWKLAGAGVAAVAAVAAAWVMITPKPYQPKPDAARWYERGLAALYDGSFLKASRALEQAVQLDPGFRMAHAHLAEAWLELEYVSRAKDALLRAEPPDSPLSRLSELEKTHIEAIHHSVQGEHGPAVERYRRLLDLETGANLVSARLDLGRAYERKDDLPHALAEYREAAKLDPQSAAAWLRTGQLEARLKHRAEAEQAYGKAHALYQAASNAEGVTEVQYSRALLEKDAGRGGKAEPLLEAALEAARVSGDVQHQVKLLLQFCDLRSKRGEVRVARRDAEKAVELARSNGIENLTTRALIDLANALQIAGELGAARGYYEQALEAAKRSGVARTEARARVNLGGLLVRLGEVEAAIGHLAQARAYYQGGNYKSQAFSTSLLLARARAQSGDLARALQEFQALAASAGTANEKALAEEGVGQSLLDYEQFRGANEHFAVAEGLYAEAGSRMGVGYSKAHRALALASLGEMGQVAGLLREAAGIAREDELKDLEAGIAQVEAVVALAQGRTGEAVRQALTAKAAGLPGAGAVAIQATARAGRAREVLAECGGALEAAAKSGEPVTQARLRLACAEASLLAADRAGAGAYAAQALSDFTRFGMPLSSWRAAAILRQADPSGPVPGALAGITAAYAPADLTLLMRRADLAPWLTKTNLGTSAHLGKGITP